MKCNQKWMFILKIPALIVVINYLFFLLLPTMYKELPSIVHENFMNYEFFSPTFLIVVLFFILLRYMAWMFEEKKTIIVENIFNQNIKNVDVIGNTPILFDHVNDDITLKVFRRLKLRYGILDAIFADAKKVPVVSIWKINVSSKISSRIYLGIPIIIKRRIINSIKINNNNDDALHIRQYNLAVTDLFVEKALSFLNRKARKYEYSAYSLFFIVFILGIFTVYNAYVGIQKSPFSDIVDTDYGTTWARITILFIKSFTFYGLLVLAISLLYRMIKSLFDQAERIKDRRHALRQGRLYVHLKGGVVDLEEMKEAFNWNSTQPNAFSEFNPDAQAPWGILSKEALKTIQEGLKSIQINCK